MLNNRPTTTDSSVLLQTQCEQRFESYKSKAKTLTKRFGFALFFLSISIFSSAQVTVSHLLTENRTNPVGLDIALPRFSWQLGGNERNIVQTAYEIEVSSNDNNQTHSLEQRQSSERFFSACFL